MDDSWVDKDVGAMSFGSIKLGLRESGLCVTNRKRKNDIVKKIIRELNTTDEYFHSSLGNDIL
jgi:hypothetical protein